jgi:hypothetical protein
MIDASRLSYKLSMVFGRGWRWDDSCGVAPGHNILTIRPGELAMDHDNMPISNSAGASPTDENFFRGNLSGDYKSDVNILSMSAKWIY